MTALNFYDHRARQVNGLIAGAYLCALIALVTAGVMHWMSKVTLQEVTEMTLALEQLQRDSAGLEQTLASHPPLGATVGPFLNAVDPGVGADTLAILNVLEDITPSQVFLLRFEYDRIQGRMILEAQAKERTDMAAYLSALENAFYLVRLAREESVSDGVVFRLRVDAVPKGGA